MTIDQPDEERNLYAFSARSAAVLGSSNVSTPKTPELCHVSPAPNPAAPEDGRTPPNLYPNCSRQGVGSIPRVGVSQRVTECNFALQRSAAEPRLNTPTPPSDGGDVPEFIQHPQTRRGGGGGQAVRRRVVMGMGAREFLDSRFVHCQRIIPLPPFLCHHGPG
jgi:hypothetical protein